MITRSEINKLETIADIGAQNASNYLTTMTKKKCKVSIPWVGSLRIEKVIDTLGGFNVDAVVIFMELKGDLQGMIVMVLEEKAGVTLANHLTGEKKSSLDEMGRSALMEAGGNILANAYLNSFADKLKISLQDTVPSLAEDKLGAIMDNILATFAHQVNDIVFFKNNYQIGETTLKGSALILFDPIYYKKLQQFLKKVNL